MKIEFIISKKLYRDKFIHETYMGKDAIFALVEKGSFTSTYEGCTENVSAFEGYCFTENVFFERKVTESLSGYFFRYHSKDPIFPTGKTVFTDRDRIRSTIELLNKTSHNPLFDRYESNYVLFYDIILQYQSEHPEYHIENSKDKAVIFAKEYLKDHFKDKINFTCLASECGLSYIQFFRRFRKETSMTPSDYLASLRMKNAVNLLESTELPVKKIAEECGFSDEYYFSNFFKKYYRISPSAYRKSL